MKISLSRRALSLALLCALAGTAVPNMEASASHHPRPPAVHELWQRTELYFGEGKADGSSVTNEEFAQFIDDEVTPRFPDGLTELQGLGQWRNDNGVIGKEHSVVLILLYKDRTAETDAKVTQIREAYKTKFQQESVLRVDSKAEVSF